MSMSDDDLTARLRDELSIPAGDDERIAVCLACARRYVAGAVGDATIDDAILADCIVTCAADLYNSRNARFGVLNAGTDGLDAVRISVDPLYSVWPKLRAAGVLTGRQVIA